MHDASYNPVNLETLRTLRKFYLFFYVSTHADVENSLNIHHWKYNLQKRKDKILTA